MSEKRRWVIAGGGTGGHVTPALALAERIAALGDEVLMLGSEHGLENRMVPAAGFELLTLPASQLKGQRIWTRAAALWTSARGAVAARRILRERRSELVVSVGGYASVPAVAAAFGCRLPFVLIEPNARPGLANRAASRFAARIFVQFEAAAAALGRGPDDERLLAPGIPLRRDLVAAFAQAPPRRTPGPPHRLLVLGGSQGARQLNDAMVKIAPDLDRHLLSVFHQTGEADRERVAAAYERAGVRAEVVAFEGAMARRYAEADLAVCRAGALTVAELAIAGLPALLIPYPFAADDHQAANAASLEAAGAARLLPSRPLDAVRLGEEIASLIHTPETLRAMGAAAAKLARPDAAERIVEACASLIDARRSR